MTRSFVLVVVLSVVALSLLGYVAATNHDIVRSNEERIRLEGERNARVSLSVCVEIEQLKSAIRTVIASRFAVPPAQTRRELSLFVEGKCPRDSP